jgi:outer membrane protein TolC
MSRTPGARTSCVLALAVFLGAAGSATAQPTPAASPEPKTLTVDQAVASGLAADPGVSSAALDARAAKYREADARLRVLPSLALSAGYTQLSVEPLPSLSGVTLPPSVDQYLYENSGLVDSLLQELAAPTSEKDVRVDLQYPIFAGLRVREAAEMAKYQALGKAAAAELARYALAFEIRRAYWEAVRAQSNVEALRKALELESVMKDEVAGLSSQGMASDADKLGEDARFDQATLALDDALAGEDLAFLMLSSLVGDADSRSSAAVVYSLASAPGASPPPSELSDAGLSDAGLAALVEKALANRPETRAAAMALDAAAAAGIAAKADLYPSLSIVGNVSYADPDPRIFPVEDIFNLSWSIGARIRYDIGAVPGALERGKAASADLERARADLERQRNAIALDLRRCALALRRARNSLELTRAMVGQAEEARRVAEAKFENGLAKRSEVLQSEMALLRANVAVENKLIDVEIAQADILRAGALE